MAIEKLPISVIICTYNERNNLSECIEAIKANHPREIIVVDGGSKDNTVNIAESYSVKVIQSKKGLSNQRQMGIEAASQTYIAFVDADDRLDKDCLKILLDELKRYGFDAVQAKAIPLRNGNYWQKAMNFTSEILSSKPHKTNMIGRPAIYIREKILSVGFDGNFFSAGIGCEDTDMAIRFEQAGFIQGIGSGVSHRIHSDSFSSVLKKIRKYGRGDARIAFKYPEKGLNIIKHELWNYPIIRSIKAIYRGKWYFVPFFVLMGVGRFFYFIWEFGYLFWNYQTYDEFKTAQG